MKDWKQLAAVLAPDIPPDQVERLAVTMEGIEISFRPLTAQIRSDTEPAYIAVLAWSKKP